MYEVFCKSKHEMTEIFMIDNNMHETDSGKIPFTNVYSKGCICKISIY